MWDGGASLIGVEEVDDGKILKEAEKTGGGSFRWGCKSRGGG